MKRLVTSSAFVLAVSAPAFAADLPSTAPAPAPVFMQDSAYNWTGFYAGANAGWAQKRTDSTIRSVSGFGNFNSTIFNALASPVKFDRSSFIGGLQAGYLHQNGNFVLGGEVDFSIFGTASSSASTPNGNVSGVGGVTIRSVLTTESRVNWLSTARLRAGFALDNVMFYGTGGLAVADVRNRIINNNLTQGAVTGIANKSKTRVGWTVGGGVEWGLTDQFTIRAEYLYYDLGRSTATILPTAAATTQTSRIPYRFRNDGHIARVGVNYRF